MSPDLVDRTNHRRRLLDRGRGFKSREKHFFSHGTHGHASRYQKYDNFCRHHFPAAGHKPKDKEKGSEENKQFDHGGKGEKAPLWNAAVTLCFFLWKTLDHTRLVACASCFLSVLCVCLSALFFKLLFFSGDHFSAS